MNGPFGSFYLRDKETPIVCIAGGSGLAPIKAILEGGVNDQIKRDVIFLFLRSFEKLFFERASFKVINGCFLL